MTQFLLEYIVLKISLCTCLLLASMSQGQNGKFYLKYRVRPNN